MHALSTAENCLAELTPDQRRAGIADPARAAIGRVRMGLEYTEVADLRGQLPVLLIALQEACVAASEAITDRFFQTAAPTGWVRGGQSWAGV
jgi:hypothetical protein